MLKSRQSSWLKLLPLIIFAGLLTFLWRGLHIDPHEIPSAMIGRAIPHFVVSSLQDPGQKLSDQDLRDRVVLLNVWASWCVACESEHPILMDIATRYHIPVYGLDYKDARGAAQKVLQQLGNPYQMIGFDQTGAVAINWGVYGTPETFVIDKQGIIRYKQIGAITLDDWQNKLLPLIKQLEM